MRRIFKVATIFFGIIITALVLAVSYDLAYYDSSYLNRNSITFSINNLNSKKTKKLFKYSEKFYYYLGYKI